MKATSNDKLEFRIWFKVKDIKELTEKGLLEGEIEFLNGAKQQLKVHYAETTEELIKISLNYKDSKEEYDFFAIYINETSLQKIENREASYFGMIWEPNFIRQGWISLEDVI